MKIMSVWFLLGFICTSTATALECVPKDTVKVVLGTPVVSLNPHKMLTSQDSITLHSIFSGLIDIATDEVTIFGLADKVDISDDSLTYTFHLRDNLTWSDGKPITAQDIVFSVQTRAKYIRDVDQKGRGVFSDIKGFNQAIQNEGLINDIAVRALSDTVVEFQLHNPSHLFLQKLTDATALILPQHTIEKYGDSWLDVENIVTSGAFIPKNIDLPDKIELTKNPYYYDTEKPNFNCLEIHFASQSKSSIQIAQNINADVVTRLNSGAERIASQVYSKESIIHSMGRNIERMSFNMKRPVLQDIRVREAITISLDIKSLISDNSLVAIKAPFLHPKKEFTQISYRKLPIEERRKTAKSLLNDAGYNDSNPLRLTVGSYEVRNKRSYFRSIIQDMEKIGIIVEPRLNDTYAEILEQFNSDELDVTVSGWGAIYDDPAYYLYTVKDTNGYSLLNYYDKEIETQIDAVLKMADPIKRAQATDRILKIFQDNFMAVPLITMGHNHIILPRINIREPEIIRLGHITINDKEPKN